MKEININNTNYYNKINDSRTIKRLVELKELGLYEYGDCSFYLEGIMSGLYIEMVWNYNDEEWNNYLNWIKDLKMKS